MMETASQVRISDALGIEGWMSEKELIWLALNSQDKKLILEIGSYKGRSSRALADNSPSNCKIYCVDPWTGFYAGISPPISTYVYGFFEENLYDHISAGKVIPIREFSDCFDMPELIGLFDLIFIDAGHDYKQCMFDINLAKLYIKNGGIIAGHDYCDTWPGVIKAVDECFRNFQLEDTIWYQTITKL